MNGSRELRIVVAEDDYLVGEEIARIIREIGHELIGEAGDGAEAVEIVCALHPDLVLMDIHMPELDGIEATRRIQACCPTPVIILTAYESQELVDEASQAGVSAYLTKPPKSGELQHAITVAVARHHDFMELCRLNKELEARNAELQKALAEIKTLRGIIPLCSFCKKVRDDKGYWEQVDVYIYSHTEADISHGICPDCVREHYPELA